MGIFSRKKAAATVSGVALTPFSQPPARGTRELIEIYKQAPWVRAVIQRIAMGVATANWRVYSLQKNGRPSKYKNVFADRTLRTEGLKALKADETLVELTDHPLISLLNKPNKYMSGISARQVLQTHLDLKGETFLMLERNASGMPVGFYVFPPHWVIDVPGVNRQTYKINAPNMITEVPESEILWLRDPDPSNPYGRGTGVAESLGDEIEISEYASKHIKAFFYNKALPQAIFSFKGASQTAVNEARERWNRENQGFWNSFKSWFTGSEIQVERLDTSFGDMEINELRQSQHDLIREVFAVPPEVLGVIENSNRSTIDAAQFLFATGVLVPRLEFLRTELQTNLVPLFGDRLILEYDSPVPEAREFQLSVIQSIPEAFTLNEVRCVAGMEPMPELDGVFAHHASGADSAAAEGEASEEEETDESEPEEQE